MQRPFDAYQGNGPYVFVSYSHVDEEIVYPLLEWLHSTGVNIWYDEGVSPGSRWSDHIAQAIERASAVLFLVTEASTRSENCQDEVSYALDQKKKLAVLYLDGVELAGGLRLRLSAIQGIRRNDLADEAFKRKVLDAISPHVGASRDAVPAPASDATKGMNRPLAIGGAIVVIVIGLLVAVVLQREPPTPEVAVATPPAPAQASLSANTIAALSHTEASTARVRQSRTNKSGSAMSEV